MKKYSIAFVVNNFPSLSETFILNQVIDLIERGHDVKIYSFNSKKSNAVHNAVERYKLIEKTTYFQGAPKSRIKKLRWFLSFTVKNFKVLTEELNFKIFNPKVLGRTIQRHALSLSFESFLKAANFDIVHSHFGQRGAFIANLFERSRFRNFKFIVTFHGYDVNPSKIDRYKIEYKNLFLQADAVTVNTKYLESILLKVCPNPKKLIVLPVGLRTDHYRKSLILTDKPILFNIIYCGRFIELKAPDLAVRIVNILVHERGFKSIKMTMIGHGELRGKVENLINNFKLQEHVKLLGALSQERVVEEMNNAHIFLLPGVFERKTGRAETQGLVIQEAQAMELPVIVSDVGGMKYGLLDGVSGFILREGDLVSFADKIEWLIKNEELRAKMGRAGRYFVVNNFDTKILGDKLLEIYSEL